MFDFSVLGNYGGGEFGISEFFGGNKASLDRANQLYNDPTNNPANDLVFNQQPGSVLNASVQRTPTSEGPILGPDINARGSDPVAGSGGNTDGGGYSKSDILNNLGISDSQYQQLQAKYGITADQAPELVNNIRSNINNQYNDISKYYESQLKGLPNRQNDDLAYLQKAYGNQLGQLGSAQNVANQNLEASRQGVVTRKADSIRELGSNLRNLISSTQNQLGAMGAADSSASQIAAPYAFAKLGSQGRNDIVRQANDQFAQIDTQKVQVEEEYSRQKSQVEQWLSDKQLELRNYYQSLADRINGEKQNANSQRLQALNSLEESLLNQAQAQANYLMEQAVSYEMALRERAINQMDTLNSQIDSIQGAGQYAVQDINNPQLNGIQYNSMNSPYGDVPTLVSGLMNKRREDSINF